MQDAHPNNLNPLRQPATCMTTSPCHAASTYLRSLLRARSPHTLLLITDGTARATGSPWSGASRMRIKKAGLRVEAGLFAFNAHAAQSASGTFGTRERFLPSSEPEDLAEALALAAGFFFLGADGFLG